MLIELAEHGHAQAIGKRIAHHYELPLTQGQDWAAKILGYASWPDLRRATKFFEGGGARSGRLALPDELCMPSAVECRRTFQAATLAHLSKESLAKARTTVDTIGPSARFRIVDGARVRFVDEDRTVDPVLTRDDHVGIRAALDALHKRVALKEMIAKKVRALAGPFEALAFLEYPPSQWSGVVCDDYIGCCGHRPRNLPRWLSEETAQECFAHLEYLDMMLRKAESARDPATLKRADTARAQIADHLAGWLSVSREHVGDAPQWIGDPPEKVETERLIYEVTLPEIAGRNRGPRDWSSLEYEDSRFLRKAQAALAALPATRQASPDIRKANLRVAHALRRIEWWQAKEAARYAPVSREWLLVSPSTLTSTSATHATDTLAARAAQTADDKIAASESMLSLLRAAPDDSPEEPFLSEDGRCFGVALPWRGSGRGDEGLAALQKVLRPRASAFGVNINANHELAEHFIFGEYLHEGEPRAFLTFEPYPSGAVRIAKTPRQIAYHLWPYTAGKWDGMGSPLNEFRTRAGKPVTCRWVWSTGMIGLHVRGTNAVHRLRLLQQAIMDEDIAFALQVRGAVWGPASLIMFVPGLTPKARLLEFGEAQRQTDRMMVDGATRPRTLRPRARLEVVPTGEK